MRDHSADSAFWGYDDEDLRAEIKAALEGDSNDAEHDALVRVAEAFGIDWTPKA